MDYINEINDYPNSISLKGTEIILEQMKNKICNICIENKIKGTGFFCKILYNNDLLQILITNNNIIDELILKNEKKLILLINNIYKEIDLDNRIKYVNKTYNITIIEIKEKDGIQNY